MVTPLFAIVSHRIASNRWRRVSRPSWIRSPYVLSSTKTSARSGLFGSFKRGVHREPRSPLKTKRWSPHSVSTYDEPRIWPAGWKRNSRPVFELPSTFGDSLCDLPVFRSVHSPYGTGRVSRRRSSRNSLMTRRFLVIPNRIASSNMIGNSFAVGLVQ